MTVIHFIKGKADATVEILDLHGKICNVKMLVFNEKEGQIDEIDHVLKNIAAYAKKQKCEEVWIPTDRPTPADEKLKALGYKMGELRVHIPGNSEEGWVLTI